MKKTGLVHFEGPDELVGQYAMYASSRTETFALFGILENEKGTIYLWN